MMASLVAGSFLSAHFCVDPGGLETPSTIVGILLLAFSEYTAMRAQTTDCVHVQAWQLPDSQLQMQDWDRHPSYCIYFLSTWSSLSDARTQSGINSCFVCFPQSERTAF